MASKGKATAESVWALLQEVAKNQKETDRRFKETDRLLKEKGEETDRRFKETDRLLKEKGEETDRRFKETDRLLKEKGEETDRRFKETDRFLKETDRFLKEKGEETDRRFKETDRFLKTQAEENKRRTKELDDLFTGQWGKLMESLVQGDLIRLLKERNVDVIETHQRVESSRFEGKHREFDILAVNGQEMVVVEIKTTLKLKDVQYFLESLKNFISYCPAYKGLKIYGAVAYLKANESSNVFAERQGLFVIRATGSSASIVNSKSFKPKEFQL